MTTERNPIFTVVLNKGSGPYDGDEILALIERTIPAERLGRILILEPGSDLRELVRQGLACARRDHGCLLLAGGDGTVNGALPVLREENDVPFTVLALGTFNYFARSQGLALEPETALANLLHAEPMDLPVAEVNGEAFVINVSLGLFPKIIDARERHQARFGRNRFVALGSGFITALLERHSSRMQLRLDGRKRILKSPMVSMVFNRYQIEALNLEHCHCLDNDQMAVLITRPVSRLGMLALLLRGAAGQLEDAEDLETVCASEVEIGLRRSRVRVAIDGETRRFSTPLRLKVFKNGLRFLAPIAEDSESGKAAASG